MSAAPSLVRPMTGWLVVSCLALVLIRDPAPAFVYDAAQYWSGARSLTEGTDTYVEGGLAVRGLLTAFVYLPAFLAARLLGGTPQADAWAVLGQNAIFVGLLGSVLLPLLVRRVATIGARHVGVSTVLVTTLLAGFVPYPLMDLPAVVCIAAATLLLSGTRWWTALIGGVLLAAAVNLRPAYAAAAVLVLVVVAVARWRHSPLAALGAASVVALQAAYGRVQAGLWSVWPPDTHLVTEIQLAYASYGVRYDTIPYTSGDPRLWHCSPGMAEAVLNQPPAASTGDLLSTMVDNLPASALFALDKVAASLHWSTSTPYASPGEQALRPLGLLVLAVSCCGLVALVALLTTGRDRIVPLMLLALDLGVAVTLVGAAPEARFALPIVVVGVVGTVSTFARWGLRVPRSRSVAVAVASAIVLTAAVAGFGWQALRDDVPRGDMTVEGCLAS